MSLLFIGKITTFILMKLYCLSIFTFLSLGFRAQVIQADYTFAVHNKILHNTREFPANVKFDTQSQIRLYKVQFGIDSSGDLPNNFFTSKRKPVYFIYGKASESITIFENVPNVKETDYVFTDNYPMKWILSKETKMLENIKLSKAEVDFRGRHYIAWYDEKVKIPVGPWKFKNTPGLIYEIYDDQNSFKWSLNQFNAHGDSIKNPFETYTGDIISYHEYPQLRYGLTPELKKELAKVPNNQMKEQERNGLEIQFEWEN